MRPLFLAAANVAVALLLTATSASADVTFDLNNVDLYTGTTPSGTLTGSFVTNNTFTSLVSANITASASGAYPGLTYDTVTNSTVTANGLPTYFQLDTTSGGDELRLIFSGGLKASGAALTISSYEHEPAGGNRMAESGSVAPEAVPEPGTAELLALMMAVLLPLALRCNRRQAAR